MTSNIGDHPVLNHQRIGQEGVDWLLLLNDTGIKIDQEGRVSDWADRPNYEARPFQSTPGKRKRVRKFSREEETLLHTWCVAAEIQGVLTGSHVYEQLECLFPAHTWQAYETKWRKGDFSQRPRPSFAADAAFPNLVLSTLASEKDVQQHGQEDNRIDVIGHDNSGLDNTSLANTPNLYGADDINLENDLTYSDFRVDISHRLYQNLSVADEAEFVQLLTANWVVDACYEYATCLLQPLRDSDQANLVDTGRVTRATKGRSRHQWKIARAVAALEMKISKYSGNVDSLDKSWWTEDDHDVRFMVVLVLGSILTRTTWNSSADEAVDTLCTRALWLMLWMRWVYKPVAGISTEMKRLKCLKDEWLGLLHSLQAGRILIPPTPRGGSSAQSAAMAPAGQAISDGPTLLSRSTPEQLICSPTSTSSASTTSQIQHVQVSSITDDEVANPEPRNLPARQHVTLGIRDPATNDNHEQGSGRRKGWSREQPTKLSKISVPEYSVTLSRHKKQQKGASWLTEDAYLAYKNHRDSRMADWGVTADHVGTCILVCQEWANIDPVTVRATFSWDDLNVEEKMRLDKSRLQLHIGDAHTNWARASVFFETWPDNPRRGVDLDAFFAGDDGPYIKMEGSHLCHHGLCINKNHLIGESRTENMSRQDCAKAAISLRSYGIPIPERCVKHEHKPCLLQHAALTTHERLLIQFDVLAQAKGLDRNEIVRPEDHPSWLSSFETQLPLSFPASSVSLRHEHLVSKSVVRPVKVAEKYSVHCPFCPGLQQHWSQITAYWSHLKVLHEERPQIDRLAEITRSARDYSAWLEARSYDYRSGNPETWIKLQQAQADNFDWEVVEGWRLHMDRHYERWTVGSA